MCLLTFFRPDVQPDPDALACGARSNRDGHGFALVIPEQNRILVRKSFRATEIIDEFVTLRTKHPHGYALFHSRLATDGAEDKGNIHPFMVNRDRRTIMAHNGIFANARPGKKDTRSDTRIVADQIAQSFHLWTRRGRKNFGRWMTTSNKVAVLSVDPRFSRQGYLINESAGTWHNGIWYSNGSYKPWKPTTQDYSDYWTSGSYDGWAQRGDCVLCRAYYTVNKVTGICDLCRTCNDCQTNVDDPGCLCFYGSARVKPDTLRQELAELERVIDTESDLDKLDRLLVSHSVLQDEINKLTPTK